VAQLFLLHWLQTVLCWLILWAFSEVITEWQLGLGFCVAVREGIYLVLTCVGLAACPAYLLFSPARSEWPQLITYVLAPEKWLCIVCLWDGCGHVVFATSVFLDMCAVGALIIGLVNGTMWTVLGIGYTVTALGGLFAVFMVCRQRVYYECRHSSVFLAVSAGTLLFITGVGTILFIMDVANGHVL
jgi:hypothetical protein